MSDDYREAGPAGRIVAEELSRLADAVEALVGVVREALDYPDPDDDDE